MENEIPNEYIENVINELYNFFGVKEFIDGRKIFSLIKKGEIKEGVKLIAHQLGLPIDINITFVPDRYRSLDNLNQFQSTHLARTSQNGSLGNEGIIAQISIPDYLPFYGTREMNNYPINAKNKSKL